jgi:hypothetical protein
VVQRVGKVQSLVQIGQSRFDLSAVFDVDMQQRQQALEYPAHVLGWMAVHAAQHPFELEDHGLGDKELGAAFDRGARHLFLRPGRAERAHVVAREDVRLQRQHQRLPAGLARPSRLDLGASRLAASKSAGSFLPRAPSVPNPDSP